MTKYAWQKRRKASVIISSPDFNEAIREIRIKAGIPEEGFEDADESMSWYQKHHSENTKEPLIQQPSYYWHFPKEIVELVDSLSYTGKPSRVNFYTDVPLDHYAMELIYDYDLPEEVLPAIKGYILHRSYAFSVGPALQPIILHINEGEEGIKYVVLVAGIDEETTKKEWLEVWDLIGLPTGEARLAYKRPVDSILIRDLSWWNFVKQQGMTVAAALEKWRKRHPDDGDLGEDAVRKAVQRIDNLLQEDG